MCLRPFTTEEAEIDSNEVNAKASSSGWWRETKASCVTTGHDPWGGEALCRLVIHISENQTFLEVRRQAGQGTVWGSGSPRYQQCGAQTKSLLPQPPGLSCSPYWVTHMAMPGTWMQNTKVSWRAERQPSPPGRVWQGGLQVWPVSQRGDFTGNSAGVPGQWGEGRPGPSRWERTCLPFLSYACGTVPGLQEVTRTTQYYSVHQ